MLRGSAPNITIILRSGIPSMKSTVPERSPGGHRSVGEELPSGVERGIRKMELFSIANQYRIGTESLCLSFMLNKHLGGSH